MNVPLAASNPLDHVVWHDVFSIGGFEITNHMIMAAVAAVLMLLLFPWLFSRGKSDAPSGLRNFFEAILAFLRDDVFRPSLKDKTDRFAPFLWTVFFFVLFCNLLGFIPIGQLLVVLTGGKAAPGGSWERLGEVGGTATGNIATTGALALAAMIFIHLNGIRQVARDLIAGTYGHHAEAHGEHAEGGHEAAHAEAADDGVRSTDDRRGRRSHEHAHAKGMNPLLAVVFSPFYYLWNFAPHLFMPKEGESPIGWLADIPVWGMLVVLELVGALIKPFALCMRLFANMIAGHIVLAVLVGLIPVALGIVAQVGIGVPVTAMSLMIRMLELFVCFLQAYIFTFLTTLFVAAAVAPEH